MFRFFLVLMMNSICCQLSGQTIGDIYINNISVYFDQNACFTGSLYDYSSGMLRVNSELSFVNNSEIEVYFNQFSNLDSSIISFSGSAPTHLFASNELKQLSVNLSQGDLHLDGNIKILELLRLINGRIIEGDYDLIDIVNVNTSSIEANLNGTSYISGNLQRNLSANENNYLFPIGDDDGFFPAIVTDNDKNNSLKVKYDNTIDDDFANSNINISYDFIVPGGWTVLEQNKVGSSFNIGLAIINEEGSIRPSENYYIFYTDEQAPFFSKTPVVDSKTSFIDNMFIKGRDKFSQGTYSVVTFHEDEWLNFILVDGLSEDKFIIPNIDNYETFKISIYDWFGNLVFKSNNYSNEFSGSNYRSGTYFYIAQTVLKGGVVYNRKGIIEIKRSKE